MNKNIQILRAFSIIAVVMIHTSMTGIAAVLSRPLLNFCVAMFLFLSGYLTKLNIPDTAAFYKKRMGRVLVPYIIWSILYIIASGNTSKIIVKLLTATATAPFYYIFVYMQLVLLTPAIVKLLRSEYRWIGWLITPVSVIFLMYVLPSLGVVISFPIYAITFLVWFVYYYMELALGNDLINFQMNATPKLIATYIVTIALSEIEGMFWYYKNDFNMATTQIRITSIGTSMAAISLAYIFIRRVKIMGEENALSRLFVKIGDCSFGIYLSHMAVLSLLDHFQIYANIIFPINSILVVTVFMACVVIGKKVLGPRISSWVGI